MSQYEFWALIISALAVLVSLGSLGYSIYIDRRRREDKENLQELQTEVARFQRNELRERQRKRGEPDLKFHLDREADPECFVFKNEGGGVAYSVRLSYTNTDTHRPPYAKDQFRKLMPIEELRPNEERRLKRYQGSRLEPPFHFEIRWEDEDGRHHSEQVTIG
jgi:hypothetical protein